MVKTLLILFATLSLAAALPASQPTQRYWVFFRDKDVAEQQIQFALDRAEANLSARSLARRIRNNAARVDAADLPLASAYIDAVAATGSHIRALSKWLNAVSVEATELQRETLRALPCVERVTPFSLRADDRLIRPRGDGSLDELNYGASRRQNIALGIPALHDQGLSGRGVLICYLDTGFRLSHEAFDSMNVVATRDFIHNDSNVANESGQDSAGQDGHGTGVLSAAAGYRDSILIGPAYGADIACAKTEWVASETPVEEDYYVAALEWADSLGADITSSSLGYIDWYNFSQLDGHTAVTTRAVQIAARRGILVVTAEGNERVSEWGHLVAPADADSILAVGAVDTLMHYSGFSSPGPTADGRIKPDVCAPGEWVLCADPAAHNTYYYLGGTSLATPLISGLAALVMEAHPDWTAQQVRTALKETASHSELPDNDYGWGVANGPAAVDYVFEPGASGPRALLPASHILLEAYPNPVNGVAEIRLNLPMQSSGTLTLFDLQGRIEYQWPTQQWFAGMQTVRLDTRGFASGSHFLRFSGSAGNAASRLMILK